MNTTATPDTTENLPDMIDRVMAWWITSELDAGGSLSWGVMAIPSTEYRRERLTTWIREMGRPAAIEALRAYAKSPAELRAIDAAAEQPVTPNLPTEHRCNPAPAPVPATPAAQAAAWAASCEALDAASPTERLAALQALVETTVNHLERAGLMPADYEYVPDTNVGELRITAGNRQFTAGMTGSLDIPAAHFIVTTTDDDDTASATERTTIDLGAVRAWLMSWSVAALVTTEEPCTHEESYLGACVACGAPREYEDGYAPPLPVGCMGRGWYHDGSEDAEAMRQRRPRRSCPSCSAGSRNS